MATFFTLLGFLAGAFTTIAFLPQVLHTYRSKSAGDLSWPMLLIFNVGLALWFTYGVYLNSWPMILANGITLLLNAFIIGMKVKYGAAANHEDAKARRASQLERNRNSLAPTRSSE